ncbi:MAG: hypothetical protein JWN56_1499 [Sphingobacteriales bacterium]|nr:hypothetical protein [Sphingobacteriales bacterium]
MKTQGLVTSYSKLSDAHLDLKAQSIILALTGNLNFPLTAPTLANFTLFKTTYTTALAKAVSRERNTIAQKLAARTTLLLNMKLLAINIESLALGDRVKLVSSGFDLTNDGELVTPIVTPTDFILSDGLNAGEMKFSIKGVKDASSYLFEICLEEVVTEDSKWTSKATTLREHTFTNLPSRTLIHGRVAAIGRKSQEAFTGVLTRVVQ